MFPKSARFLRFDSGSPGIDFFTSWYKFSIESRTGKSKNRKPIYSSQFNGESPARFTHFQTKGNIAVPPGFIDHVDMIRNGLEHERLA